MSRAGAAGLAALAALLLLAAPASARLRETGLLVRTHGAVSVEFEGDPAAGCEEVGSCSYSGTITWAPPREGFLFVDEYGRDYQKVDAALLLGFADVSSPVAQVTREMPDGGSEVCSDVAAIPADYVRLPGHDREIEFGLRETDILRTRCAGPLAADVAPLAPTRRIPVEVLRRGGLKVDLSGEHAFSSHGFSGTVKSTLRFALRDPEEVETGNRGRGVRFRELTAHYDVRSLTGSERVVFSALRDPFCGPIDACGTAGSVLISPEATRGRVTLVAIARADRPRRDLRAALGLSRNGTRKGVDTYGYGGWRSDTGSASATLTRADGSPTCRDSARVARGGIFIEPRGSRMRVLYGDGFEFGLLGDPLRTRCPGPLVGNVSRIGTLAAESVPRAVFGERDVTVRLDEPRSFSREGYRGTASPDLTLELRRTSVRERVFAERFP